MYTNEAEWRKTDIQPSFSMVAGNHDHHGNVTGEIMYSNHASYGHLFIITLQLLMIDTVELVGIADDKDTVIRTVLICKIVRHILKIRQIQN